MKIIFALIVLLITTNFLFSEDTCPHAYVRGDFEMWNAFPYLREDWSRDNCAVFLNMQKDDWDEGWGWKKCNDPEAYKYELPKMMYAERLLWGLNEQFSAQGPWSAQPLTEGPTSFLNDNPQFHAVSRYLNGIDLFYRGSDRHLRQLTLTDAIWYAGDLPSNQIGTDISTIFANAKNKYHIEGEPAVMSPNAQKIDIFARCGPYLYHFFWSSILGWKVECPTESVVRSQPLFGNDRFFIMSNPIAINRSNARLDVFAYDNYRDLIHYAWSEDSGWSGEDITNIFGREFSVHNEPTALSFDGESLDVFSITFPGDLLHFQWSASHGWQAHNITKDLGTHLGVCGVITAVSKSAGTIDVFARSYSGNHLIHYHYDSRTWNVKDLTDLTRSYSFIWAIFDDPLVLSRDSQSYDIFAKDYYNRLIHYYWQESIGWGVEDLSYETHGNSIDGKISALSVEPNRIDVFGRGPLDHLLHYYWYSPLGWKFEDATELATNHLPIRGDPIIVSRYESSLDLIATRGPLHPSHFAAAIGPCVRPWHWNQEYAEFASGDIHGFKYKPGNTDEADESAANSSRSFFIVDRVQMNCPSFNTYTSPAVRAGYLVHESTHMNFWNSNPPHEIGSSGYESDPWIFHTIGDPNTRLGDGEYAHDWDESYVEVIDYNHSPYQVQIEYLSDVYEFADWFIPFAAYSTALAEACWYMNNCILDPPGWVPGTPRPLY